VPASLTVNLGERSYPIRFDLDLTDEVRQCVEQLTAAGRKVVVVTDRHVADTQKERLAAMFGATPVRLAPPGESSKSVPEFGRVLDFLAAEGLDRGGVLFALGGGVVGDLGGFAAASYLRGIDYYQVPTTLLAMVDSSVGGKTGINLRAGKNLAGAFHQPRGVFIATDFLRTLSEREFAAGAAEVIKYGLLGDAGLLAELESARLSAARADLPAIIRRCCAIKARIVEADEREEAKEGGRALLNLGHTFGHATPICTARRWRSGSAPPPGCRASSAIWARPRWPGWRRSWPPRPCRPGCACPFSCPRCWRRWAGTRRSGPVRPASSFLSRSARPWFAPGSPRPWSRLAGAKSARLTRRHVRNRRRHCPGVF